MPMPRIDIKRGKMGKKTVVLIVVLVAAVFFLYPKNIHREYPGNMYICNCLGPLSGDSCLGVPLDCSSINTSSGEKPVQAVQKRQGVDIIFLLDKSMSMSGRRLDEAKSAADDLIGKMADQDRMAIAVFDTNSMLLQDFTDDMQRLKGIVGRIRASGDTFYAPALKMAKSISQGARPEAVKKIIFLSDGEPASAENLHDVYDQVYSLTDQDICLYTIGYGNDVKEGNKAEEILKNMAEISSERAGCGKYYRSLDDWYELSDIFNDIYRDKIDQDLKITIDQPRSRVYNSMEVPFSMSTNVPAVCSYSLDGGPEEILFQENFTLEAEPGKNTLHIVCSKSQGFEQKKSMDIEFFVSAGIRSYFQRRKLTPSQNVPALSDEQVEFLFDDIIKDQELDITKRMSKSGSGTLVYVLVRNTKPVALHNVRVQQMIPQSISSSIEDFSSNYTYQLTDIQPITLSFGIDEIGPDQVVSLSYFIKKSLDSDALNSIKTKVTYDQITRSDIKDVISAQNRTRDLFYIKSRTSTSDSGTDGIFSLTPKQDVKNIKIYLKIPKCMAYSLNKIYFKDRNYEIISDDPMVLWQLADSGDGFDIEYHTDQELEEDCEKQISIVTIGQPVQGQGQEAGKSRFPITIIFPMLILPLIFIVFVNMKLLSKGISETRKKYIRALIFVLLIVFSVIFFYPKDRYRDDRFCECFGVANQKQCYGLSFSCSVPRSLVETQTQKGPECIVDTCKQVSDYISLNPFQKSEPGVDLLIMLDRSKSMGENDKMQQAKASLINLVNKVGADTRISIIKFDNASQLVQNFTSEKPPVISSINSITPGLSTMYIPALVTAHQNFLKNGNRQSQWRLFFVSDGAPADPGKPESIFNKVREMAQDDICINTLGFGSEITPGSEAEYILKEMASISYETTGCGAYYYSPREMTNLSLTLGRMYDESVTAMPKLDMELKMDSMKLTAYENFLVQGKLYSEMNGLEIPGRFQLGAQQYCSPPADVRLVLRNDPGNETYYSLFFDPADSQYKLDRKIPAGKYKAYISAYIRDSAGDSCDIYNTLYIGDLDIEATTGFDQCQTNDCNEINRYLFSNTSKRSVMVFITDYAYVPQNLTVTSGTTVLWKNIGKKAHTVTSGRDSFDGSFHSTVLYPGQTFNYTFKGDEPTEYFDNLSTELRGGLVMNRTRNYTIGNFSLEYKKNIDLSILIDRSGSMMGQKLDNVKEAAKHLVGIIYPGDRISVLKFSEDASIATPFTADRSLLLSAIDNIHSGGSTLYVPAFQKAKENYDRTKNSNSGKVIIFLSDGEPWDRGSPYSIYDQVGKLIDKGICIYAIGYGDEVYPGSRSEEILKHIVQMSEDSTKCGNYVYSPSNEIRLSKIFGSIYLDAVGEIKALKVEARLSKQAFYDNGSVDLFVKVRSGMNNNYLPGYIDGPDTQCGPPALVTVSARNSRGKVVRAFETQYQGETTGYYAKISGIDPGKYTLDIDAESVCSNGDSCYLQGENTVSITVLSSKSYVLTPLFIMFLALLLFTAIYILWKLRS